MAYEKYFRGWLLAPLLLGAAAMLTNFLIRSEPLPDLVVSLLVYSMIAFMFGGIPYALCLAFVWQLVPTWRPRTARVVTICYPWLWLCAVYVLLALGHSEHRAASAGFPWATAAAFATWAAAVIGLERILVDHDSRLPERESAFTG